MAENYRIPMHFKEGCYGFRELKDVGGECIEFTVRPCDMMVYNVPVSGYQVELYELDCDKFESQLRVTYDENGNIRFAELHDGDDVRLLYIDLPDEETAEYEIRDFAEQTVAILSDELISRREKAARLFVEYHRDIYTDLAVKIGTPEDMQAAVNSIPEEKRNDRLIEYVKNNSGDYPNSKRIPWDTYTISIMIMCSPVGTGDRLRDMAIDIVINGIRRMAEPALEKTEDYRFIAEEYD